MTNPETFKEFTFDMVDFEKPSQIPPGVDSISLEGMPIRAMRMFDIGEPGEREPCFIFRLDVHVSGFSHPFITGWTQPQNQPDTDKAKLLKAIMGLGVYTKKRINE